MNTFTLTIKDAAGNILLNNANNGNIDINFDGDELRISTLGNSIVTDVYKGDKITLHFTQTMAR